MGLKLLIYRGMSQDSKGAPYPMATPGVRDGRQVKVGKLALTLGGRYGLWRKGLRAFYHFRDQTRKINQPLLLPVTVLSSLKLYQSVFLSLDDQIRRSYLVSQMEAESPGIDGKASVRLEVLMLPTGIDQTRDVDEPEFFVELTSVQGPLINIGFPMQLFMRLTTYTIKYWANAQKTIPAGLVNRSVKLRRIRKGIPGAGNAAIRVDFHEESVVDYPASGNGGTLDPAQAGCLAQSIFTDVISYYKPDLTSISDGTQIDAYTLTLQLDPSEDYTIL